MVQICQKWPVGRLPGRPTNGQISNRWSLAVDRAVDQLQTQTVQLVNFEYSFET